MKHALYKSTTLSVLTLAAAGCLALTQPAMAQTSPGGGSPPPSGGGGGGGGGSPPPGGGGSGSTINSFVCYESVDQVVHSIPSGAESLCRDRTSVFQNINFGGQVICVLNVPGEPANFIPSGGGYTPDDINLNNGFNTCGAALASEDDACFTILKIYRANNTVGSNLDNTDGLAPPGCPVDGELLS